LIVIADLESAKAAASSAQSSLERAKITLPMHLSVSHRRRGRQPQRRCSGRRSVPASAPDAFTIAGRFVENATAGEYDEADIARLRSGNRAFTVDAYPDRQFAGTVTQIRLQPTTVRTLSTYTVVIDLDNPILLLCPA